MFKGRKKQDNYTKFDVEQRKKMIESITPEVLPKPGISAIKQVELYTKWRPLIHNRVACDSICPKPTDDVLKMVKNAKNLKASEKRNTKIYPSLDLYHTGWSKTVVRLPW